MYGPSHQGIQSSDASNIRMNNNLYHTIKIHKRLIMKFVLINFLIDASYKQEEPDFVNDMQNYSLTYNEGASAESPTSLHLNTNSTQNIKQSKQGPKNSSGKDSSYQIQQKGKQTGTVKGSNNKI